MVKGNLTLKGFKPSADFTAIMSLAKLHKTYVTRVSHVTSVPHDTFHTHARTSHSVPC